MTGLLIYAPLGIEARALRRGLPAGPPDVTLVRTGLGVDRAAGVRSRRSGAPPPGGHGAVAVAGFGGALDEGLRPGDVLVATEVWFAGSRLPCAEPERLVRELASVGVRAQAGPLMTVDHLVREKERRRLSRTGARAVDMEAGPLLAAADLPVTVVRAIVDVPGRPLLSPASLTGGLAARRALRRVGPALVRWSHAVEAANPSRAAPFEERGYQ